MKSVNRASLLIAAAVIVVVPALSRHALAGDAEATDAAPSAVADKSAAPASTTATAKADATPSAESAKPDTSIEQGDAPAAAKAEAASAPPAAADAAPAATPPATTAEAKPDPDAAIAAQLHDVIGGKFDTSLGNAQERATVDAFYSGRNYAPLWVTDGKPNARAAAAIAYLGHVDADGLIPADYPVPDFANASDPSALAQAEIRLTASVVTYAHHASIGRVHWTRVSGDISYDQKAADPADVLGAMVARHGCRTGARCLRAARSGLPCAQGEARRDPRRQGQQGDHRGRSGAEARRQG